MAWKEGHGLDDYLAKLDALDGKSVHVTAQRADKDKADFDRKVRESLERQTRRAQIAGG